MKKSTKILSLILSVLTLLGVFSVATPVLATEVTEYTNASAENVDDKGVSSEEAETEENEEAEIVSEIEDMRTEHTKYFRMSDGSYMAAQYAQPVHYKENGEWKEYDYSITENESEFLIENSDSEMSFPEEFETDDSAQIEVSAREYDIKFSPVVEKKLFNKNPKGKVKDHKNLKSNEIIEEFSEEVIPQENSNKNDEKLKIDNQKSAIAYEEVYSDVDLEYEISSNQIKESIVLNSKQDKNKFEFIVDTDGLFPKKEADGSITLYEDEEYTSPVSSIMKPYMYDAEGVVSYDVTMDIKEKKGTYILTVKADNNWLNDKARKYPVVIDPTIVLDVGRLNTIDCYVDNSQPNSAFGTDYYLYAGYNSYGKTRTFVQFKLPALPDKCAVIQNASIRFCQSSVDLSGGSGYLNLYNVTSEWKNDGTVTWNKQPTYDSTVVDYCQLKSSSGTCYFFDITKSVKAWYEGSANYGLMLKTASESAGVRTQLYSAENYTADIYPQIYVTYLNNKGLESYWSYSSYSNDTAGVAYINDYTGNLVYELPILSSVSEIMPLTLTAIYNTYSANIKFSAGKDESSKTTPGKGFRLNVQQTVLPSSQYGFTGDAATEYPYIYTDADGTEHYIIKTTEDGATVYKDEDGLSLTLTTSSTANWKYCLTDKQNNKLFFNEQGNLYCERDANGNELKIYFKEQAFNCEPNQMISHIVDGAGHKFTFTYYKNSSGLNNGYIETITDDSNRTIKFDIKSGLLKTVSYPDNTSTSIAYCSETTNNESDAGIIDYVKSNDGYALNFDYTSTDKQVKTVKERALVAGIEEKGQAVTFDRTKYNQTVIRSSGIDGYQLAEDENKADDDIVTTLQFDNSGRTISQQVSYGSGAEIGAGNYSYTSGASALGSANKVSSSASLGKNTVNLITNGNAETTDSWVQKNDTTVTTEKGNSAICYMGEKSLYIKNTGFSASGASFYSQSISNPAVNSTYTLSAYVRTGTLTKMYSSEKSGAYIQLSACNSSGAVLEKSRSEKLTQITDEAINGGWRRLTVSLTIPANTTKLNAYLCLADYKGLAYFDCIQLEKSGAANTYNLLENSSFENHSSYMPTNWSVKNITYTSSGSPVTEGATTATKKEGSCSVLVKGSAGVEKHVYQRVAVAGNPKDTYIVSGWAKGTAVNSTYHYTGSGENAKPTALFDICPEVKYTKTDASGNKTTVYQKKPAASFNTTITGWQYTSTPFSLKYTGGESGCTYTPEAITVILRYYNQANTVYFDHIQLIKEPAPTYTYDKKGNLVSTQANSEQSTNAVYNAKNDLTSYTDTAGNKTTLTYDSNRNLLRTKSAKGVVYANGYNANGTLNANETRNADTTADSTMVIRTNQTYFTDNTSTTVKENAFTNVVFDEHGNDAATYTYDFNSGKIKTVKDAKGTVTTNSYNSNYTRLNSVTTDNTSVKYSYTGDRVNKITFSGTDGKNESYGFTFDNFGNVTTTKVGNQILVTNEYEERNGLLGKETYGNNDKKATKYNNLGLIKAIETKDADSSDTNAKRSYEWTYSSVGVALSHTDNENNLRYLYDYDSLGRLIRQEIQDNGTFAHVGSTEVTYDVRNNVTKVESEFGGNTAVDQYLYSASSGATNASSYTKDNLVSRYKINGLSSRYIDYTYDEINRLTNKKLQLNGKALNSSYTFKASDRGTKYTTSLIETEKLDNTTYKYYYDKVGNITGIDKGSAVYRNYTYDNKNQLTKEVNATTGITTAFTYDAIGNITKKVQSGAVSKTINYRYGNDGKSSWNNLLTGVDLSDNGAYESTETISYDAIGNPTTYLGASLSWYGRQLKSYTKGSTSVSYTYDADGLRGTKIYNGTKSTYHYVGGQLRYETRGNLKFYYFYDAYGNLSAIRYHNASGTASMYYVLTNIHGDVLGIYSGSGDLIASYEYDAWGKVVSVKDANNENITSTSHIANLNPIRYRGYYYDTETGLYYLQSRYYNPQVGRFLNADGALNANGDLLGYNMFAYCSNNPVMNSDPSGKAIDFSKIKKWIKNISDAYSEFKAVYKKVNKFKTAVKTIGKGIDVEIKQVNTQHAQNVVNTGAGLSVSPSNDEMFLDMTSYELRCQEKYEIMIGKTLLEVSTDIRGKSWSELNQEDQAVLVSTMGAWDIVFPVSTTLKKADNIAFAGIYSFITGEEYYE